MHRLLQGGGETLLPQAACRGRGAGIAIETGLDVQGLAQGFGASGLVRGWRRVGLILCGRKHSINNYAYNNYDVNTPLLCWTSFSNAGLEIGSSNAVQFYIRLTDEKNVHVQDTIVTDISKPATVTVLAS